MVAIDFDDKFIFLVLTWVSVDYKSENTVFKIEITFINNNLLKQIRMNLFHPF